MEGRREEGAGGQRRRWATWYIGHAEDLSDFSARFLARTAINLAEAASNRDHRFGGEIRER
jgi:hypothetical protein